MNISLRHNYIILLNEYIINKIPKNESSLIKILDVGNFLILKGFTTYNKDLDILKIVDEFRERYDIPENIKMNTIDLIEYSSDYDYFKINNSEIFSSTKFHL
jgi:hypothetical protein